MQPIPIKPARVIWAEGWFSKPLNQVLVLVSAILGVCCITSGIILIMLLPPQPPAPATAVPPATSAPAVFQKPTQPPAAKATSAPTRAPATAVPTATSTNIPPTQRPPTATSEPQPRVTNFLACSQQCNGIASSAVSSFPEKTTTLWISLKYDNIPAGAQYERFWTVDGREWVHYTCSWNGPASGTDEIRLWDMEGLTSGTWQVTIRVNGVTLLQESLQILGNHNIWTPAGDFDTCYGRR